MSKIMKIKNVSDYSRYVGQTDRHPLVSVIDYAEVSPKQNIACYKFQYDR